MNNRAAKLITTWILIAQTLTACGQIPTGSADITGAASSTTVFNNGSSNSISAALYLNVAWAWEGWDASRTSILTNCQIPAGAATGTTITCNLPLPEGQLHFSNLYLNLGSAGGSACKQLIFQPYAYLASTSAGYIAPNGATTAIDCSVLPRSPSCYDGPATRLLNYPTEIGEYIVLDNGRERNYTIASANSLHKKYNTYVANFMTDPTVAQSFGASPASPYVANSKQDYQVTCVDQYFEVVYQIVLKIQSIPYLVPGVNTYGGWI